VAWSPIRGLFEPSNSSSAAYRKHYFAQRASGTLSEFTEAIKRLDAPGFGKFESTFDQDQSKAWNAAAKFLAENRAMNDKVRNDVGAVRGSRYAVERTERDGLISLTIESDITRSKRLKFDFAGDLA
jgi:hypothetical protein